MNTLLISAVAKSTICTISDKAKEITDCAKLETPLLCGFNTATITITYLIYYLTQLTTYSITSLSKIPAAIPSSSSHLIQHLISVHTSCIQYIANSHTLKLIAFYIKPLNTKLNPICEYQLAELFCGAFKLCAWFSKNLNVSRTKGDKFVKQKTFCGEENTHSSVCLRML